MTSDRREIARLFRLMDGIGIRLRSGGLRR
jgi:hypothetical protein